MSRVLIVEDEPMIGRILLDKMKREGHEVVWVREVAAAFAEVSRGRPDLVLLDTSLGDPDGFEVLRRWRADPRVAEMPVVVLTEYGRPAAAPTAKSLGADECIEKPFKPTVVARIVKNLLARSGAAPAPPASA